MKLAEALMLRSDLQKRLEQLRERLSANALTQEGEQPAEDPRELLQELDRMTEQLEDLVSRINLTNASTVKEGKTLTELLSRREALSQKVSILRSFLDTASRKVVRGSHSEVKICSTVEVPALRKDLDRLSQELRVLDASIQSSNWLTDLK